MGLVLPAVTDVATTSHIDTGGCKFCLDGTMVTTTTFTFVDYWCANPGVEDTYEIIISEKPVGFGAGSQTNVAVTLKQAVVDCYGPSREMAFQLSTTELKGDYIILNPTASNK